MAKALNLNAKQDRPTDGVFVPVYSNAGAHNSIYRGKNIQDKYSNDTLYTAIENGTFNDLFIGDFFDITITTSFKQNEKVRCLLAGFDAFWNSGDRVLNRHHAVIVPMNCFAITAKMNTGSVTTDSYCGSEMYKTTLPVYATALKTVFGEHLIKNREFMGTTMTDTTPSMAGLGWNGATTGCVWQDCELRLMSEVEVYGSTVFSSSAWDVGSAKSRLPLFTLAPNHVMCGLGGDDYASATARRAWWLSAVASATNFAYSTGDGVAYTAAASSSLGVRPRFLIS